MDVVIFAVEVTEVVLDQLVLFIEALVVDMLALAYDNEIDPEFGVIDSSRESLCFFSGLSIVADVGLRQAWRTWDITEEVEQGKDQNRQALVLKPDRNDCRHTTMIGSGRLRHGKRNACDLYQSRCGKYRSWSDCCI